MRRHFIRMGALLGWAMFLAQWWLPALGYAQEAAGEPTVAAAVGEDSIPLQRALAYLAGESVTWVRKNHCYSCHNNSDAVVALVAARQAGWPIADAALLDTATWLASVDRWDNNGGDAEFADRKLAVMQFATALSELKPDKLLDAPQWEAAMAKAAARVVDQQREDGSWATDATSPLGSPAAVGLVWGTVRMRAF